MTILKQDPVLVKQLKVSSDCITLPTFFSTNQSRNSGERLTTVSTALFRSPHCLTSSQKRNLPLKFESSDAEDLTTTHYSQE